MRKILIIALLSIFIGIPVCAVEYTAPQVPQTAQTYMPDDTENFAQGLWYIVRAGIRTLNPSMTEAMGTCAAILMTALLVGLLSGISEKSGSTAALVGIAAISVQLFQSAQSMIRLGTETVQQVSQYGKLLLPVITGAVAAQGNITKSGMLYTATAFLDAVLSSAIAELLIPLVYMFLCASVAYCAFHQEILKNIRAFLKWVFVWGLKIVLYVFTGYISITGVIGGSADAAALKAAKLAMSGMVPVVGGIISDASEAVLVSAGLVKNSVGIYGLLAILAIWIAPFLRIGVQYLMLKASAGICEMFGTKEISAAVKSFSEAMGIILAMIGTVCLTLMISTVCFMKGVG